MSFYPPPLPVSTTTYVLADDTACVQCGYNLRTLSSDARCPECNAPVAASLTKNYLRFSHPEWIGKLELAIRLMLWQIVTVIVAMILATRLPQPLGSLLNLANTGLSLVASWLLTTPEPQAREDENNVTVRQALRIFAVISAVGTTATTLGRLNAMPYVGVAAKLLTLGSVASTWLFCLYMYRLALRIPNEKLARSSKVVMWGLTICVAITAILDLLPILGMSMGRARRGTHLIIMVIAVGVVGIGLLVFAIWWLILVFRFRRAFATAHRDAIGHWQRAMATVPASVMS